MRPEKTFIQDHTASKQNNWDPYVSTLFPDIESLPPNLIVLISAQLSIQVLLILMMLLRELMMMKIIPQI